MRNLFSASMMAALVVFGLVGAHPVTSAASGQAGSEERKPQIKPDVAALIRQSTDAYKKMKSYRHTAKWSISVKTAEGEAHEDLTFTLALERPNRFAYKMDSKSQFFPPVAAYCDGTQFINFKARLQPTPMKQYIKLKAPETYKGINIVDDVEFQPIATYIIALMLQGDALADKDVRAAMEKATIKPMVTENGRKWQVLEMPFGTEETPIDLFIGQDDHLIGKATQKGDTRITEIVDAIKIDKPIEAAVFQYALPPDAKQVERFTAPQRPGDARLSRGRVRVAHR